MSETTVTAPSDIGVKDNKVIEQNENPVTENYILYSIASSLALGLAFIYLFLWKVPGISYFLFYSLVTVNLFLPAILWSPEKLKNIKKPSLLLLGAAMLISTVFMFRMQAMPLVWTILLLPFIYAAAYASIYNPAIIGRFGLLTYFAFPVILIVSWFADLVNLIINFRFQRIKSARTRSIIKRVIAGIFISLPILFLFLILMASADYAFADLIESILRNILGDWLTFENIVKLIIGGFVAIYFAVFNFSMWNEKSGLSHMLKQYAESKVIKIEQSWDPLIFTIVLVSVNFLFLTFIAVQFVYLFGGEEGVVRGGYTYAQYARRGFKELLLIAMLVYGLVYGLNLKVKTYTQSQLVMYKANFMFLLLMALIINISGHTRLYLTEAAYGYTGVRIIGHFIMMVVGIMLVLLASFSVWKESFAYINKVNAIMVMVAFAGYLIFPGDYLVGKLNVDRFNDKGLIDIPYLLSLSDEAVPAYLELLESDKTSEITKSILISELEERKERYDKDAKWQSLNFFALYNKVQIKEALNKSDNKELISAEDSLKQFLKEYETSLKNDKYSEVHSAFWSTTTTFNESKDLEEINILEYDYESIPQFKDWSLLDLSSVSLDGSRGNQYWDGMYISINMKYQYRNSLGYSSTSCRNESLRVKLENGEWKVNSADYLSLGENAEFSNAPITNLTVPSFYEECY